MSVKLLNEYYLEFLSLTKDCTGSSESTLVKMSRCWKSHVVAQYYYSNTKSIFDNGYCTLESCCKKTYLCHAKIRYRRESTSGGSRQCFKVINVFHREPYKPPSRGPRDPIASREGSVPVFLRKSLATCDFPGGGGGGGGGVLDPCPPPPPTLSSSAHGSRVFHSITEFNTSNQVIKLNCCSFKIKYEHLG